MKYRAGRLGEEIRRILSQMLLREQLKDPRLSGMISITAVEVSEDGSYATIFFSILGAEADESPEKAAREQEVLEAFGAAKGLVRREISRQVKLRYAPELAFKVDHSMEYGRHMNAVIDSLDIPKGETETDGTEEF